VLYIYVKQSLKLVIKIFWVILIIRDLQDWKRYRFFTALASEERGNVIARVCMSVRMSVCVSLKCATNRNSPRRCGTMGFYLAMSHLVVLDVTLVRDDRNLSYSDISRGDELKPN
jgi:hypothetical protein